MSDVAERIQNKTNGRPVVLCISGLDPSGGAGLQADIETLAVLNARAVCALSACTIQDGGGLRAVVATDADILGEQIAMLTEGFTVDAVKVGMLPSAESVAVVGDALDALRDAAVVVDPVRRAAAGGVRDGVFGDAETLPLIRRRLVSRAEVATPNRDELRALVPEADDVPDAARTLVNEGCRRVLVTGASEDAQTKHHLLISKDAEKTLSCPKLPGEYHGGGCTLAAAIAAGLADGMSADDAVERAQQFTWSALANAENPNRGQRFPRRSR